MELTKRCLAVEARDRPRDARIVAQDIGSYLESLEELARTSQIQAAEAKVKVQEERRARRLTLALAATVVLATVVGGVGYQWATGRFERALTRAQTLADQATDTETWVAANEAAMQAKSLALTGNHRARWYDLDQTISRELQNHALLGRLERIRDQSSYATIDQGYADSFKERFGAHVLNLSPQEAKEAILETEIAEHLAIALDDWALVRRTKGRDWKAPSDLAMAVHPEGWRFRMWMVIQSDNVDDIEKLPEILAESDAASGFLMSAGRLARRASKWIPHCAGVTSARTQARSCELSCQRFSRRTLGTTWTLCRERTVLHGGARTTSKRRPRTRLWSLRGSITSIRHV